MSKLLGEMLQREMRQESRYEAAKRIYMAQEPGVYRKEGKALPARAELHDR